MDANEITIDEIYALTKRPHNVSVTEMNRRLEALAEAEEEFDNCAKELHRAYVDLISAKRKLLHEEQRSRWTYAGWHARFGLDPSQPRPPSS